MQEGFVAANLAFAVVGMLAAATCLGYYVVLLWRQKKKEQERDVLSESQRHESQRHESERHDTV
jgi:uncharacterized membrane protein YebE (DUF533 family)